MDHRPQAAPVQPGTHEVTEREQRIPVRDGITQGPAFTVTVHSGPAHASYADIPFIGDDPAL